MRTCTVPADLCATGWHVCGARTGSVSELTSRTSQLDCANAGGGRYVAAISHCLTQSGCSYDLSPNASYPCFPSGWCSESVCCGTSCRGLGACPSGTLPWLAQPPVGPRALGALVRLPPQAGDT